MKLTTKQSITLLFGIHARCGKHSKMRILDTAVIQVIYHDLLKYEKMDKITEYVDSVLYIPLDTLRIPSSFAQLAVRGPDDTYLMSPHELTFWKTVYPRHANFGHQCNSKNIKTKQLSVKNTKHCNSKTKKHR